MNQESDLPSSAKKRRFEFASLQLTWSGSLLNSLVHACRLAALDASLTGASLQTCVLQYRQLYVTLLLSNPLCICSQQQQAVQAGQLKATQAAGFEAHRH